MQRTKVRRRIQGALTAEQLRRVKRTRKAVAKELPDLVHRNQLRHRARKQKTLSGALRRAVHGYPLAPWDIAKKARLSWDELSGFLTGEKPLDSNAMDRLAKIVKFKVPAGTAVRKSKAS